MNPGNCQVEQSESGTHDLCHLWSICMHTIYSTDRVPIYYTVLGGDAHPHHAKRVRGHLLGLVSVPRHRALITGPPKTGALCSPGT